MGDLFQGLGGVDPLANLNAGMGGAFASGVSEDARGAAEAASEMSQFRIPGVTSGAGSVSVQDGNVQLQLSDPYRAFADQYRQGAGAFGQQATQALSSLGSFDPEQATMDQFTRMEEFLAPLREQQRRATEERLLAQGRLGSTGGALTERALEESISQQQLANLIQSSEQAQQQQMHLANMAGGLFGQSIQGGQAALGVEQVPLGLFQAGLGYGQAQSQAGARAGSFLTQQAMQQAGLASGYGLQERGMQHDVGMSFMGAIGGGGMG